MNTDVSARIGALELGILPPLPHDALLEATVSVPPLTQGHSPWGRCFGDGALESAAAVSLGPTQIRWGGRCFGDGALESAAAVSLGPTQIRWECRFTEPVGCRRIGDGALESAAAVSLGPTQNLSAFCHRIEVSTPE
ncbi:MAG: hypothetical protein FJX55_13225 [Alphaproteobacteria bacterium]|nr:hypothetical protein [Alphaproteobacteria bacterium]